MPEDTARRLAEIRRTGIMKADDENFLFAAIDERDKRIDALTAERDALVAALNDALDGMLDMLPYVPDYFAEKWDHLDYVHRARGVLGDACLPHLREVTPRPEDDDAPDA